MTTELKDVLEKLSRFNEWEIGYTRNLPIERKLRQFLALYDFIKFYSDDGISQARQDHLDGVIESQKRLAEVANRSGSE